ncbi:hypothetical protein [Streptomyces sp. NPDC051921]|uniref:hypothetical protein n=1 Tax=Streptomyces sp. NPDC051921 TaxID=3155806 RepID=UPI00341567A1
MSWNRATSLVAVVLLAGLGLTACGTDPDSKGSDKPATTSAAPSATDSGAPSEAPGTTGDVKVPDDLPAGLPLPDGGKLTSVTGDKGAYMLAYRSDDPKGFIASYRKALEGAGYTVVDIAGVFTATSDKSSVSIATSGNDVILTVASM